MKFSKNAFTWDFIQGRTLEELRLWLQGLREKDDSSVHVFKVVSRDFIGGGWK